MDKYTPEDWENFLVALKKYIAKKIKENDARNRHWNGGYEEKAEQEAWEDLYDSASILFKKKNDDEIL